MGRKETEVAGTRKSVMEEVKNMEKKIEKHISGEKKVEINWSAIKEMKQDLKENGEGKKKTKGEMEKENEAKKKNAVEGKKIRQELEAKKGEEENKKGNLAQKDDQLKKKAEDEQTKANFEMIEKEKTAEVEKNTEQNADPKSNFKEIEKNMV